MDEGENFTREMERNEHIDPEGRRTEEDRRDVIKDRYGTVTPLGIHLTKRLPRPQLIFPPPGRILQHYQRSLQGLRESLKTASAFSQLFIMAVLEFLKNSQPSHVLPAGYFDNFIAITQSNLNSVVTLDPFWIFHSFGYRQSQPHVKIQGHFSVVTIKGDPCYYLITRSASSTLSVALPTDLYYRLRDVQVSSITSWTLS